MKKINKILLLVLAFGLFVYMAPLFIEQNEELNIVMPEINDTTLEFPEGSTSEWDLQGDSDPDWGSIPGDGSSSNPEVITISSTISGSGASPAIQISGTTKYIVIQGSGTGVHISGDADSDGIFIFNSPNSHVTIKNLNIQGPRHGIHLRSVNNFQIYGNNIRAIESGIRLDGNVQSGSIHDNTIHDIRYIGIWLSGDYNNIYNNEIYNIKYTIAPGDESGVGIWIRSYDEKQSGYNDGGTWNNIYGNYIHDSTCGIYLQGGTTTNNHLYNNKLINNARGYWIYGRTAAVTSNTIEDEIIKDCSEYGMYINNGDSNTITNVTFFMGQSYAMYLTSSSTGNSITDNNFAVNNDPSWTNLYGAQCYAAGSNTFSGNYWDNLFGRSSISIAGGSNVDNSPRATPRYASGLHFIGRTEVTDPKSGDYVYGTHRIQWRSVYDSKGYTVYYYLDYDRGSGWNPISGAQGITNTYFDWSTSSLTDDNDYRIRVRAYVSTDNLNTYSNSDSFIVQNHFATQPTIVDPTPNEIHHRWVHIQWNAATLTYSSGVTIVYDVDYKRDADGSWINILTNYASTQYTWDALGITPFASDYRIRVTAKASYGLTTTQISAQPFTLDPYQKYIFYFYDRNSPSNPVSNAYVNITNGVFFDEGTTDANGRIEFLGTYPDSWTIKVRKTIDSQDWIIYNHVNTITETTFEVIKNYICDLTNLVLTVQDKDGVALNGVNVHFERNDNPTIERNYVTPSNGVIEVREITADSNLWTLEVYKNIGGIDYYGYRDSSYSFESTLFKMTDAIQMDMTNLMLHIKDKTGGPLSGATVRIEQNGNPSIWRQGVTDANGNVTFTEVPNQNIIWNMVVTINVNGKTYEVLNTQWNGETNKFLLYKEFNTITDIYFELQLEDLSGNPVGSNYEWYIENLATHASQTAFTTSTGNVSFSGMTNGNYWIQINKTIGGTEYITYNGTFFVSTNAYVYFHVFTCYETNLVLHIGDLDGDNVGAGLDVYLENLADSNENYNYTTDANGNITIILIDKTSNWKIIVYKTHFDSRRFLVINSTLSVNAVGIQHAYFTSKNEEYTAVEFTVTDIQGKVVIGANITFWKGSESYSQITDQNGKALFREITVGTWAYRVTFQLLDKTYILAENLNYLVPSTSSYLIESLIENAQMAQLNLTVVDDSVTDPRYWAINDAKVTLYNASSVMPPLKVYYTDENGNILISLPTETFNFTVEYAGLAWKFVFQNATDILTPIKRYNQTLNMGNNYQNGNICMNVSLTLSKTLIEIADLQFDGGNGWDQAGAQYNGTAVEPYEFSLFEEDNATITFIYYNISADPFVPIGTDDMDAVYNGNWNITDPNGQIIQSDGGYDAIVGIYIGGGKYVLKINTTGWYAGIYILDLELKGGQYYYAAQISVSITVLNHTTSLTRTAPTGQIKVYWSDIINFEINYTSIYPYTADLTSAVFYYDIIGINTHQPVSYSGSNGIYQFSIDTSILEIGAYDVRVYGNQSFNQYRELIIPIEVDPLPSKLSYTITADQRATFSSLKTSIGENITFTINWTELDGDLFTNYALATVNAYLDGNPMFVYYQGGSIYLCTMEAGYFSLGVHTITINATYPHYESKTEIITATILQEWNTQLSIITPLTYHVWGNNVSFEIEYSCIEHPRSGLLLDGGSVFDLNITYKVGSNAYEQLYLDSGDLVLGKWGFNAKGNGIYEIWFKTSYINVSSETLFYATPTIKLSNYQDGSMELYFYLRPITTDLFAETLSNPGVDLTLIELGIDQNETIDVFYYVNDPDSQLNGIGLIEADSIEFKIYNNSETNKSLYTPGQGSLTNIGGGHYRFTLNKSFFDIGNFKVVITFQAENHTESTYEFLLTVNYEQINVTLTIPSDIKITSTSMKIASGENITFTIMINNIGFTNPTLNVYIKNSTGGIFNLTTYLYPTGTPNEWLCTAESTNLTQFHIGSHKIYVNISKTQYTSFNGIIICEIVQYWETELELIVPLDTYSWNEIGWFVINYTSNEYPRSNWVLPNATINNLKIMNKDLPSDYVILTNAERGIYWNWTDLSTGDAPGYPGSGAYGPGSYLIWFNTSVVNVSSSTTYYIIPEIGITYYRIITLNIPTAISPLNTLLEIWAVDDTEADLQRPLSFLYLEQDDYAKVYVQWNVSDPDNILHGMPLDGETIPYAIYYRSDLSNPILQGNMDPVAGYPGRYNLTLITNLEREYYVRIWAIKENYTSHIIEFGYNVGTNFANFTIYIPSQFEYQANSSIKTTINENITFYVLFDGITDPNLIDVTLNIQVNGIDLSWYPTADPYVYLVTNPANIVAPGIYQVQVMASKINYRPWTYPSLELVVTDTWNTAIDIIKYPTIYPWSNNASFKFKYYCIDEPRDGLSLDSATIYNLTVYSNESSPYVFNSADLGTVWGYSNLGSGIYELWFDTQYIDVDNITYFFIKPYISQQYYTANYPLPHLWISPVKTDLDNYFYNTQIEDLILIQDVGNRITLELNDTIYLYFNYTVNDPLSILDGTIIDSANFVITIYQKGNSTPFQIFYPSTGDPNYPGLFILNLKAIRIGEYTINITVSKPNFVTQIADFEYIVTPKSITYQYGEGIEGGVIITPRNRDIAFKIYATPGLNLNVTIGDSPTIYQFTDSGNGVYIISFSQDILKQYDQNVAVEIHCVFYKTNYTTKSFDITLNIGFDADPYLGIPYLYWGIIFGIIAAFLILMSIRRAIILARIPTEIKRIDLAERIIEKDKPMPEKPLALTATQEIYRRFAHEWKIIGLNILDSIGKELLKDMDEELREILEEEEEEEIDILGELFKQEQLRKQKAESTYKEITGEETSETMDILDMDKFKEETQKLGKTSEQIKQKLKEKSDSTSEDDFDSWLDQNIDTDSTDENTASEIKKKKKKK
ncbi:MAG: right-handed parallel beta-helix repeat-containing protein [Promethearchaeota archaeon]